MFNKVLLSAAALAFLAAPAFADHHEGDMKHHKDGKHKVMKMMEKKDANGDGMVSRDEYVDYKLKHFNEMDANDDGMISEEEAMEAYEEKKEKWEEKKKKWKERKDAE